MTLEAPGDGVRNSCREDGLQGAKSTFWVFLHSCGFSGGNLAKKKQTKNRNKTAGSRESGKILLIQKGRIWERFWECSGPVGAAWDLGSVPRIQGLFPPKPFQDCLSWEDAVGRKSIESMEFPRGKAPDCGFDTWRGFLGSETSPKAPESPEAESVKHQNLGRDLTSFIEESAPEFWEKNWER